MSSPTGESRLCEFKLRSLVGLKSPMPNCLLARLDREDLLQVRRDCERQIAYIDALNLFNTSELCSYCHGTGSFKDYDCQGSFEVRCYCGGKGYHEKGVDPRDASLQKRRDDNELF